MNGGLKSGSGELLQCRQRGTRAKENAMSYATEVYEEAEKAALAQWLDDARLAYITTSTAADARKLGIIPADSEVADATLLYLLHDVDGKVLGFTDAWDSAYGHARMNDLTLLSVH
jgi:hypothetical protein